MSITIGRIANKFWTNADWDCPNGFPIYEEQQELKFDTPNMNDFMSGTIYLFGDSWNHCKYEGAYYSLHIVHSVSDKKKRYLYRLERDLWMDMLIHRPRVVGDLSNSNNDELLEANLNRTFSVLDNPARVITVNFGNVDFDGTKNFTFEESKKELTQTVLSRNDFNQFVSSISGSWIKEWKFINEKLYFGKKDEVEIKEGSNAATFIFSYLNPSTTTRGGKHVLREKINEFVRSIETDKGKELKLSKINSESFKNSRINGNYCITHKVDGISTTSESVRLKKIDLSQLTDIVPVTIHSLIEVEPYTPLGKDKKSGLFDIVDNKSLKFPFLAKIRRKAYIPINATENKTPKVPSGFGNFKEPSFNGNAVKDPQLVNGSFGGKSGTFNLGFLDNVNFIACYDGGDPSINYSTVENYLFFVFLGPSAAWRENYNGCITVFKENSYFDFPRPWLSYYSPFDDLKNPIVPFGFLIYGLRRDYASGKRYEYIGNEKIKQVYYWSGIKNGLLSKYSASGEGGSSIDPKLASIQPTEEFTKFYLDNYNFTWLCFFPTTKYNKGSDPYLATDGGGTYKHTNNTYYIQKVLNRDIYDVNGKKRKSSPYNDERYPADRTRVDVNLHNLLNSSLIDLPEGILLEQGDYLFSDLDYEIIEYPITDATPEFTQAKTRLKKIAERQGNDFPHIGARLIPCSFLAEDMVQIRGGKIFASKPDEKMVVLCTTEAGGMEVRTLETFDRELSISSSDDEIVQSVDGIRRRNTRFTLIKKVLGDFVDENFKGLTDKHRVEIIHAFYRVHGYKTKINDGVAHGNGFYEEDFEDKENFQQLFDLVGTDGYAFVAKGKISLIAKRTDLFEPQKGQSGKLLHEENKDLNLSLVEKINQKVRFQFFGVPYYLNGKTSFSDKDKISFKVESIKPTELQTNFDQYFISLDTGFDQVYYENNSIAKKQTKGLSPADSVQIEKLNLDMVKAQYSYQIDSDKYKIAMDRFHETIRRSETDLYHSRLSSGLNLGAAGAAGAFGTGVALKYRKGRKYVTTLGTGGADNPNHPVQKLNESTGEWEDAGFVQTPINLKQVTQIPGKTPNIMAGLVAGAVFKTTKLIMDHAFRFPEEQRRIGKDKQIGAAELALESLALNTKFIEKQINAQLAINQKTNIYSNPIINEREIMESFMDKDEGHGKKLKPAHLVCFVPSEEQLVALKEFKDNYGVMCDIPNIETNFYEGMPPDVIRYRNLDDDAITGLPNEGMRAFLKSHLLAGIKIRKVTKETFNLLSPDDFRDKIFRLNTDLHRKAEEIDAKDKQIVILNEKVGTIENTVRQECAQKESELQRRIREIEEQVNAVNKQLRDKIAECDKAKADCEAGDKVSKEKIKELEDEVHKFKVRSEELEQELADARRRAINEQDEINRLKKQIADKEKELEEAKKTVPAKPAPSDEDCELMVSVLKDPYTYDVKARANGGNGFMDLVFELATSLTGEGRSGVDQKLLGVSEVRKLVETLEELKNQHFVDQAIEIMALPGWPGYVQFLSGQGGSNGDLDEVQRRVNKLKNEQDNTSLHALKAILDELNYLAYKAKKDLGDKLKKNQDLQFLFTHIYPGKSLEFYKKLYGDPNLALIRKRYGEEIKCIVGGTGTIAEWITRYKKEIDFKVHDIPTWEPPQVEEPIVPLKPVERYVSYLVDGERIKKAIGNAKEGNINTPIWHFSTYQDAYGNSKRVGKGGGSFEGNPNMLSIRFGNGPYYKSGSGSKNKKVVGFYKYGSAKYFPVTSPVETRDESHSDYYMESVYFPSEGGYLFKQLGRYRHMISIPQDMINSILSGDRQIKLRAKLIVADSFSTGNEYDASDRAKKVAQYSIPISINKPDSDNSFLIPEDEALDLVKLIFLLHYFHIKPYDLGKQASDGYWVYGGDGGELIKDVLFKNRGSNKLTRDNPNRGNMDNRIYNAIQLVNSNISKIRDKIIDLDLGWIFGMNAREKYSYRGEDIRFRGKFISDLGRYYYRLKAGDLRHPGEYNEGHMMNMFKKLDEIRKYKES